MSKTSWWHGAAIYQIYPLSFCDASGDGWGDIAGIRSRLDHIASLGVDAIWLSPVFPTPLFDFGYDMTDQRDIDPLFGSLADFDGLLADIHARGMKLILDQVYSYTSHRHHWFQQSRARRTGPFADWYVWADAQPDGSPPNNWQAIFGGPAWSWDSVRRQYYMHHFYAEMPHLNVNNPAVQAELLGTAAFWLDRGVDGFRLDVINLCMTDPMLRSHPLSGCTDYSFPPAAQVQIHDRNQPENLDFVARLRALGDRYGDRLLMGEVTSDAAQDTGFAYTAPGLLHTAYQVLGGDQTPATLAEARAQLRHFAGTDRWPTWCLSNHDIVRGRTRWSGDAAPDALAAVLNALLISLPGNILLYQGDELGLPHADLPYAALRDREGLRFYPHGLRRDGARTPMPWLAGAPNAGFTTGQPWLPVGEEHAPRAVDRQEADAQSILNISRRWLAQRRASAALRHGDYAEIAADGAAFAFRRDSDVDARIVAINLGATSAVLPVPTDLTALETLGGAAIEGDRLLLPPWSALMLGR